MVKREDRLHKPGILKSSSKNLGIIGDLKLYRRKGENEERCLRTGKKPPPKAD